MLLASLKRLTYWLSGSAVMLAIPIAPQLIAQQPAVILTPAVVEAGSPELIQVDAPAATSVEGEWLGHTIHFFPGEAAKSAHRTWYALAGVDVETPAGASSLKISIHLPKQVSQITTPVEIHPAAYKTSSITVPPKFVEPGADELKEIDIDRKIKTRLFATVDAEEEDIPLWSGSFEAPVKAPPTDSFGTRRMFNGKLASIHKGTDFKAATGTPVHAGNSGRVILAQHLYYEGNCIMIDHGMGLISISMHLSRIDVSPGQQVSKGQLIGLSGATGRVSGPHLHWAIRWQGAMLDPAKLLHLNLTTIH